MRKKRLLRLILLKLDYMWDALDTLKKQGEKIMATQAELATALNAVNDKLVKIGTETTTLLTLIADLKTQVANAPVSAELLAAFDKVAAQAQVVDDLVPDSVPPTP